jgi:hypothetical protein
MVSAYDVIRTLWVDADESMSVPITLVNVSDSDADRQLCTLQRSELAAICSQLSITDERNAAAITYSKYTWLA